VKKPKKLKNSSVLKWILLGFICLLTAGVGVLWQQTTQLKQQLTDVTQTAATVEADLAERLREANATIAKQTQMLSQQTEELSDTRADLRETKQEVEDFEDEYRDTIKTVKDLAKLTQIDEELLQQYSRVSFLNENYVPRRLVKIDDRYVAPGRGDEHFHAYAWRFLEKLLEDAARDDVTILVLSAYRSFNEQGVLKGRYLRTYGEGANAFSAEQGFSEHQLGTAVDFTAPELGGQLDGFADTKAYQWVPWAGIGIAAVVLVFLFFIIYHRGRFDQATDEVTDTTPTPPVM